MTAMHKLTTAFRIGDIALIPELGVFTHMARQSPDSFRRLPPNATAFSVKYTPSINFFLWRERRVRHCTARLRSGGLAQVNCEC